VPPGLPAPYLVHERIVDEYGYAALDGNFYWVPGTGRGEVIVLEFGDRLKIYRQRDLLAEYPLPADGVKNARFSPEGQPKPRHGPRHRKRQPLEEERRLRAMAEVVGRYLDFAAPRGGAARHRFIREVFRLSQQSSAALFLRSVERALKYRAPCPETLRRIVLLHLGEGATALPHVEIDEHLAEREAYQEGRLTDAPDFSAYSELIVKDEEEGHG
jgi:hypothetical protein